jgi:hypothetical protein
MVREAAAKIDVMRFDINQNSFFSVLMINQHSNEIFLPKK